jgi:hypothetical protein
MKRESPVSTTSVSRVSEVVGREWNACRSGISPWAIGISASSTGQSTEVCRHACLLVRWPPPPPDPALLVSLDPYSPPPPVSYHFIVIWDSFSISLLVRLYRKTLTAGDDWDLNNWGSWRFEQQRSTVAAREFSFTGTQRMLEIWTAREQNG